MAIVKAITRRRMFWSGDLNPANGGHFYTLEGAKWGYVDAVRVCPCSDANGPENLFWIEQITVNLRKGKELDRVLDCVGASVAAMKEAGMTARQILHASIDAHIAYGAYDAGNTACVQVGPHDEHFNHREWSTGRATVDVQLRADACIGNYARKVLRDGC